MDTLSTLLGGAILWNYLIIFLATIFEIINLDLKVFFLSFDLVSAVLFLFLLPILFMRVLRRSIKQSANQNPTFTEFFGNNTLTAYIVIVLVVIGSITFYSYILNNWDAVFVYLPIAKGTLYSGRLLDNPLFPANPSLAEEWPPAQLILYAWAMQSTSNHIRFIPLIYLLITILATYGIAKELLRDKHASLVSAAFLITFPAIQILAAHKGFYLDLSMMAYTFTAFFFLLKGLREGGCLNFFLCGASLSMAAMSKEPAVLLIPLVVGIILAYSIKRKLLNVILSTTIISSPFLIHYILNARQAIYEFTFTHGAIVIAIAVSIGLVAGYSYAPEKKLSKMNVLAFISSFLPAIFTYSLFIKALLKWVFPNYGISPESQAILLAFSSATYGDVQSLYAGIYLRSIQVYRMFAHGLTAGTLILPIIVGLLSFIYKLRKGDKKSGTLMYLLIFMIGVWMYFFNANISSWEFRRLAWVAPLFSIVATEGMYYLASRFKSDERSIIAASLLTCSVITIYFWVFKARLDWLNAGSPVYGGHVVSLMDVAIYSAPVLLSLVLFKIFAGKNSSAFRVPKKLAYLSILAMAVLSLSLFFYSFIPQLTTFDPSYYDTLGSQPDHIKWAKDVEDYLKANRMDGAILGSSISAFSYTADVKTVDIRDFVINKPGVLKEENVTRLRENLRSMGIKYILAPNEEAPLSTYPTWKVALEIFPSLSRLMEEGNSKIIMRFNAYTLYEIS
ncbi:glycosyltransferase family 39 protein [Candidatus Bathyarchaeota archaeon]|nr:glycosyltransferase family 39 protein [Candidatus Bathyarchaeota archaeon]